MSNEGENVVEEIQPDKEGKYPETVPWNQYVGIKESLGKKLDTERTKVTGLEEQLKNAVTPEEHGRIKQELEDTKTKLTDTTTELTDTKEKTLTEKRETLTKRGIPEDKVKDMSAKELDAAFIVLEHSKPGPDMGSGGGASSLATKSMEELGQLAYGKK